jgi:hypothetical protein
MKPYVQIDNTYTEDELRLIFLELDFLHSSGCFGGPEITGTAFTDGVANKKNHGIFLDHVYSNRATSNVLKLNRKLFGLNLDYRILPNIFRQYKTSDYDSTLLSYYGNGDYYRGHIDNSSLTMVTYLFKQPKKFTGGEIVLVDYNETLEAAFNRTYIFPGYEIHAVNAVNMADEDAANGFGRYCISNFVGFKNS